MRSKKTLWTKNFTVITLGTVISAVGGVAMNVALSLVVFDHTSSAWLTALYSVLSMLPSLLLPVLFGPAVDRISRRKLVYRLDAIHGCVYLLFGVLVFLRGFDYILYVCFGLLSGFLSALYEQAYNALYPDLIPEGFMQKGYSVSAVIYPTVTVIVSPLAAFLYSTLGIHVLILGEGVLLLLASAFETQIRVQETLSAATASSPLRAYAAQLREAFRYLRNEKGLRCLYINMAIINGASYGVSLMVMAFFQTSPVLTTVMYSLLLSAETLGRTVGGLFHYIVSVPRRYRYPLTRMVYLLTSVLDGALLFLPYPLMIGARFFAGFAGVNTATLRETAVQHHLPPAMRARINGLLEVMCNWGIIGFRLGAGTLGDALSYRTTAVFFSLVCILSVVLVICRNRRYVASLLEEGAGDA